MIFALNETEEHLESIALSRSPIRSYYTDEEMLLSTTSCSRLLSVVDKKKHRL